VPSIHKYVSATAKQKNALPPRGLSSQLIGPSHTERVVLVWLIHRAGDSSPAGYGAPDGDGDDGGTKPKNVAHGAILDGHSPERKVPPNG
jgi:hypothetical protein